MRLLAIHAALCLLAAPLRGESDPLWLLRASARIRYDDNILRYSNLYIDAFRNRQDEGRYHIGTLDDVVLTTDLRLERRLFTIGEFSTTGTIDGSYFRYLRNPTKNWGDFGLGLRQGLPFGFLLSITYLYIPDFYIRHYRDDDWVAAGIIGPEAYQPYSYQREELRFTLSTTLPTATGLRFAWAGGRQYHNEHFTEYDAVSTTWLWEISQRAGSFRAATRYEYQVSPVRRPLPGRSDASSKEDEVTVSASYGLRVFGRRASVEGSAAYARRSYTTRNPVELDALHAGRVDHSYSYGVGAQVDITREFDVGIAAGWRRRDSTAPAVNDSYISLERDFVQFQIEATATYALRF